jgi:hypothetical protein
MHRTGIRWNIRIFNNCIPLYTCTIGHNHIRASNSLTPIAHSPNGATFIRPVHGRTIQPRGKHHLSRFHNRVPHRERALIALSHISSLHLHTGLEKCHRLRPSLSPYVTRETHGTFYSSPRKLHQEFLHNLQYRLDLIIETSPLGYRLPPMGKPNHAPTGVPPDS